MSLIVQFVKVNLQPGSVSMIMLLFTSGVVLLYARPRWGRIWLTAVTLCYWLIATPLGASLLARSLTPSYGPLQSAAAAAGASAVVMLGGGSRNIRAEGQQIAAINGVSALRVIETARLYHLLGDPLVIVSGGSTDRTPGAAPESQAYQAAARALGVPEDRLVSESESLTTRHEVVVLKRMLQERGIERFVLVTSPLHIRRSMAAFAAEGLHPIPSPAPLRADRGVGGPVPIFPNEEALEIGNDVIYEWAAAIYYWANGWTRSRTPER